MSVTIEGWITVEYRLPEQGPYYSLDAEKQQQVRSEIQSIIGDPSIKIRDFLAAWEVVEIELPSPEAWPGPYAKAVLKGEVRKLNQAIGSDQFDLAGPQGCYLEIGYSTGECRPEWHYDLLVLEDDEWIPWVEPVLGCQAQLGIAICCPRPVDWGAQTKGATTG